MENTYYASREVSNYYETAPALGNIGLIYALGLCPSPYSPYKKPHYIEDLRQLNRMGIYLTPGGIVNKPRYIFQFFNANTDSYWYQFQPNAIAARKGRAYAVNYPQYGRVKMLAAGNVFRFYLLASSRVNLPQYVRLGKFMSKARIDWQEILFKERTVQNEKVDVLLNPLDIPDDLVIEAFDVINLRPVSLLSNVLATGKVLKLSDGVILPAKLKFGVDSLD